MKEALIEETQSTSDTLIKKFTLLEKSIEKQKWDAVLLLLCDPELEMPENYWKTLVKHADQIITPQNLQADFLSNEYLRWSLTGATPLGKIMKRKDSATFSLFKPSIKQLLEQELSRRNRLFSPEELKRPERNKNLIKQMTQLVIIDQAYRDKSAQEDAVLFKQHLEA